VALVRNLFVKLVEKLVEFATLFIVEIVVGKELGVVNFVRL